MKPENTAKRYPQGHPAVVLGEGYSQQIEAMEAEGQQQLVNSDWLPVVLQRDRPAFEALGFTFGEPDKGDPLFCPATLPEGWRREGSDHAMWSYLVDQHGHQRVAIFYKAAYYDRSAFMRLESLDWYVTKHVEHGGPLILDDEWATREAVAAALARGREGALEQAAEWRGYGDSETCTKYVAQYEDAAQKYADALEALAAEPWCNHDAPAVVNGVCECGDIVDLGAAVEAHRQATQAAADALDRIASLLAVSEFHAAEVTISEIAAVIRGTGRTLDAAEKEAGQR